MQKSRIINAQALACALLLSVTVIAMDDDESDQSTPRSAYHSLGGSDTTPPTTPPHRIAPASPTHIPHRPYLTDGTLLSVIDMEFFPHLGGEITQFAAFEIKNGVSTGNTVHKYLKHPRGASHPKVKSMAPLNPDNQETFQQAHGDITEILEGHLVLHHGPRDMSKLAEQLSMVEPKGTTFSFESKDLLDMHRRDDRRAAGEVVQSPPPKKTVVVSGTPQRIKREFSRKTAENRNRKLDKEARAELRSLAQRNNNPAPAAPPAPAVPAALAAPKPSYTQEAVAQRMQTNPRLAMLAVGLDPDQVHRKHSIPAPHIDVLHFALTDAQLAVGTVKVLEQQQVQKAIRKQNARRSAAPRRAVAVPVQPPQGMKRLRRNDNQDPAPGVGAPTAGKRARKDDRSITRR